MEVFSAQLELTRPAWLLALLLLPLLARYGRRSLTGFPRWRQAASFTCRALLIVVLVVALCGIRAEVPTRQAYVVLAVDQSESVADASRKDADAFVSQAIEAAGRRRVAILPFARQPASPQQRRLDAVADLDTRGTNLAAAIRAARAMIPPVYVPHVVLVTDGVQTEGDALRAARAAGVPISTVPLTSRADPEVYVSAVQAKGQVRQGEPFYVEAVVHSSRDNEGTVKLFRNGLLAGEKPAAVTQGENRVRFSQSITAQPVATFTARIEGFRDTLSENNSAGGVVFTTARPRVLLVDSEPVLARHLAAALKGEEIDVEVRRPDGLPDVLAELEAYELLILSNVPAASLGQPQMDLLRTYVRDFGGGLIVVGGDRSLTPGGYRGTTLEEILPLWCEFERKQERPSLAMVLLIDRSGSMKEGGAIELAKEATRRAVNLLDPKDQLGVIAFQDYSRWVSPIQPCSDKQQVLERIDTITAGGGTNMYPALEKAYLALDETFAELKHVIVLTDGVSHPGDFDALVARMAESGITVSTVAVGPEAVQPLLEDMARIGQGHYYYCDDAEAVPRIFTLETAIASKLGIVERPFRPRVEQPPAALAEVDLAAAPSLLGYVGTRPKSTSQLVLTADTGEPLLIWWRYGLGMTVAFTSDIHSRWAAAWLRWPEFGRFWGQLARLAMRKGQADNFLLHVEQQPGRATLTLEAADPQGRYLNGAEAALTVVDPKLESRQLAASQVAPGRYAAEVPTPNPGTYYLELRLTHQGELVYAERRGVVVGYAEEFRTRPADRALLRAMADATGGLYDPEPADVFTLTGQAVPRTVFLWPYFLTAAALIFVVDVAVRRVPLPRPPDPDVGTRPFVASSKARLW